MSHISINCDLGERGIAHPIDDEILPLVDMINLACGGHAGDVDSVQYYLTLAEKHQVKVSAHLSFPDKENFGRKYLDFPWVQLEQSLEEQLALFQGYKVNWCKPHGALYHAVHQDKVLAENLLNLLQIKGITGVVGMGGGDWQAIALKNGFKFQQEAFAERKYILQEGVLTLSPRIFSWSSIHDLGIALNQALQILVHQRVNVATKFSEFGIQQEDEMNIVADTLCIHSDSEIALELCRLIKESI